MDPIDIGRWIIALIGYGSSLALVALFVCGLFYVKFNDIPEKDKSDFRHGIIGCVLFSMMGAIITTVLLKIL